MSENPKPAARKPLLWLAVVAFASGALAGQVISDSGASSPDRSPASGGEAPAPADLPAVLSPGAQIAGKDQGAADGGFGGASVPRFSQCRTALPGGLLTAGGIDLSKAGFSAAIPPGFTALSAALSVLSECDENGIGKPGGDLTLETAWRDDASGIEASISQRKSDERIASVFRGDFATFWANGYQYSVGVNRYDVRPAASAPVVETVSPSGDPRAAEVLRSLVARLAGSSDALKCFWTLQAGDWPSLATIGVGDPRPAIPAGYVLTDFSASIFAPPAAGCDTSLEPTDGASMNAGWTRGAGSSDFSYLGVSAWALPEGYDDPLPGSLNQFGANWNNGKFQFSVYAKTEKGLPLDTIRAIARALDPSFNEACLIHERQLSAADMTRLGFRAPVGQDGYTIIRSSTVAQEIGDGCPKPQGWEPSYNLAWTLERGPDTIEASASRYGDADEGAGGFIGPNAIWWTDAAGTHFSVNGYSRGVSPEVPRDDLIAVAKSMDPAFDESKLTAGPDVPQAMPERATTAR